MEQFKNKKDSIINEYTIFFLYDKCILFLLFLPCNLKFITNNIVLKETLWGLI